jgi:uncharacterized membrane protein YdbT with pleckstrin-like domain
MDLHPGERIVFEGHPSWRGIVSFYLKGLLVAVLLGLVIWFAVSEVAGALTFVGATAILILVGLIKRVATRYVITTERLHIRRGLLSRRVQQTHIERVQNVNTEQSPVDRLLRVGKVDFDTAGTDDSDFTFEGVARPGDVVAAVDRAQRGRQTESREAL